MTDSGQQPGWYYAQGDPAGTQRYWDGTQWVGGPQTAQGGAVDSGVGTAQPVGGYGVAGGGGGVPGRPPEFGSRVIAYLIDVGIALLVAVAFIIVGFIISFVAETAGAIVLLAGLYLGPLVVSIWNMVIRQGSTGQSIGKKQQNIKLVSDASGQPLGAGMAFVRYLVAGAISGVTCGIGGLLDILWPLWDEEKKRLTDKVLKFSVVDA